MVIYIDWTENEDMEHEHFNVSLTDLVDNSIQ